MDQKPTIYLGADHAGFATKEDAKSWLNDNGYPVEDLGAAALDPNDDYPQYGHAVASAVADNPGSIGILSCGNAEGICIVANKVKGIRAAIGYSVEAAKTSRTDDDANVLCLPGRLDTPDDAQAILQTFLNTAFSGAERHERRLEQVADIEEKEMK